MEIESPDNPTNDLNWIDVTIMIFAVSVLAGFIEAMITA